MKVRIESIFESDKDTIIRYVNLSTTLDFISHPILKFIPTEPSNYPVRWQNGSYRVSMKLFNLIPLGVQTIKIEKIKEDDPEEYIIRDNGSGNIVKTWDHWIYIQTGPQPNRVKYIDQIEIKAGIATLPVWFFAHLFYRWRQHRWKYLYTQTQEREKL
jgi:hypothetical protein